MLLSSLRNKLQDFQVINTLANHTPTDHTPTDYIDSKAVAEDTMHEETPLTKYRTIYLSSTQPP